MNTPFTDDEIAYLAALHLFPAALQPQVHTWLRAFAQHSTLPTQNDRAQELHHAGTLLFGSLVSQRLDYALAKHRSLFGPESADRVRQMLGHLATTRKEGQDDASREH